MSNSISKVDQVTKEFVSHLIARFKLEENPFTRGHIVDLISSIPPKQYREFSRRLSEGDFAFKDAFQKISAVADSFKEEYETGLFAGVEKMAKEFCDKCYGIYMRVISDGQLKGMADKEKYELVKFDLLKNEGKPLLDKMELYLIKEMTPGYIASTVLRDQYTLNLRVIKEIKTYIIRNLPQNQQHAITSKTIQAALPDKRK